MTVFAWLFMGHLIGDFVLQNDWMARGKKNGLITTAGMTHFVIYTLTIGGGLVIASRGEKGGIFVLGAMGLVFVSHWLIDATGLVDRWMRFYRHGNMVMVRMMIDQTFHLLILAGIAAAW